MNKLTEDYFLEIEQKFEQEIETHYFQVDFLKAVMIFLVIFDHIVAWSIRWDMGAELWERISIPVFLVIMGFNMGLSFQRKGESVIKGFIFLELF